MLFNKKLTFFIMTLFILILGISAISAADDVNMTSDSVAVDVQSSSDISIDNVDNKEVKSLDDNNDKLAEDVNEQTVSNVDDLKSAWTNIQNGDSQTDYVLNIKNGQYTLDESLFIPATSNITKLSIIGEDVNNTILDGQSTVKIMNFTSNKINVSISNITFLNGFSNVVGGAAIYTLSNLTVDNCLFQNNFANKTNGGAIYFSGNRVTGRLFVNNSLFINNTAQLIGGWNQLSGGAICSTVNTTIINSIFQKNVVNGGFQAFGSAVSVQGTSMYINVSNNIFEDNFLSCQQSSSSDYVNSVYTKINSTGNIFIGNLYNSTRTGVITETVIRNATNDYYPKLTNKKIINSIYAAVNGNLVNTDVASTDNVVVSLIKQGTLEDTTPEQVGPDYCKIPVTTSSDLIDSSELYLTKDNNYSVTIDTSVLTDKFDDITIYVYGVEVGSIKYLTTNLELADVEASAGTPMTICASVDDGTMGVNVGEVEFRLNNLVLGRSSVKLGKAYLNYTPEYTKEGVYNLTAEYFGTVQQPSAITNASFNLKVEKVSTILNATERKMHIGEASRITGILVDVDNNPIRNANIFVTVNNQLINLTRTNSNGKFALNFTPDTVGINNVTVVYGGNNKYNYTMNFTTISVGKNATILSVDTTEAVLGKELNITGKLVDKYDNILNNQNVEVAVNGKWVANVTTDENGEYTYSTVVNTTGTLPVKVRYMATDYYGGSSKTISIDVSDNKLSSSKLADADVLDLYVSDATGNDTYDGSEITPFKTIQAAINKVADTQQTANIHLLAGTFKGMGNTNLTVDGNLNITFIGAGIDQTFIDGEANYTIGGASVWGNSSYWNPYDNGTGNWIMEITKGNGLIKLTNFTIQKAWVNGIDAGDAIDLYDNATVDNYANLVVDNMKFFENYAGVGGAIRNNANATLTVTNSLFEKNRKSESTGNDGAAIYNNGTCTITDSIFDGNIARWGTILNDHVLNISNSIIQNGIAYEGGSTFKFGSGIAANSGGADFFNPYGIAGIQTIIEDCTFINNGQTDIYVGTSQLNVTNCNFINSTGIYASYSNTSIINNTFDRVIGSSLSGNLGSSGSIANAIVIVGNNTLIENNNIMMKNTTNTSLAIKITGDNNKVFNNTMDRRVIISGNRNIFDNNNVTTNYDEYAIEIGLNSGRNNISNNYLVSKSFSGPDAVDNLDGNYVLANNNTPKSTLIRLNDTSYERYFDNKGYYETDYGDNITIQFTAPLTNKRLIFENVTNITMLQQQTNFNSTNVTIYSNDTTFTVTRLRINNNENPIFVLGSDNNSITSSCIFNTKAEYTIVLTGENNTVRQNTLIADLLVGNNSVYTESEQNTITANNPTYLNVLLTNDNYNDYFDENNTYMAPENRNDVHLLFTGDFYNKTFIFNNNTVIAGNYSSTTLYNCTFIVRNNTQLTQTNMTIINDNYQPAIIYENITNQNRFENNTITTNNVSVIIRDINNGNYEYLQGNNITTISDEKAYSIVFFNAYTSAYFNNNNIYTVGDTETASIFINNTEPDRRYSYSVENNIITVSNNKTIDDVIYGIYSTNLYFNATNYYGSSPIYIGYGNITTVAQNNAIGVYIKGNCGGTNKLYVNYAAGHNGKDIIETISNNFTANMIIEGIPLRVNTGIFKTNSQNSVNILLKDTNATIANAVFMSESENNTYIMLNNICNSTIENNTIISDIEALSPIQLVNSSKNMISDNNILVKDGYTIQLDENSISNSIKYNNLISNGVTGDVTVNASKDNQVRDNGPVKQSNYLLTDFSYGDFFDENGVLKSDIQDGDTIQMVADVNNKALIINKAINFVQSIGMLNNCTLVLTEDASNSNLTNINITNYEIAQSVVINASNVTMNIDLTVRNENTTYTDGLIINGNDNNVITNTILISSYSDLNVFTINGNSNEVRSVNTYRSIYIYSYNDDIINVNAVIINGDANKFNLSSAIDLNCITVNMTGYLIKGDNNTLIIPTLLPHNEGELLYKAIILENADYNDISIQRLSAEYIEDAVFLALYNSSFNYVHNGTIHNYHPLNDTGIAVLINDNSNDNRIHNLTINYYGVLINNSTRNELMYNNINSYDTFAINITDNTVNNTIKHNNLQAAVLSGNDAVSELFNNTVAYNTPPATGQTNTTIVVEDMTSHYGEKVNITATVTTKTGAMVENGTVTFTINNKTYTADVTGGIATVNYKVERSADYSINVKATYEDNEYYATNTTNAVITLTTMNTTVIVEDVNGILNETVTLVAHVYDEDGNAITGGRAYFKVNGETLKDANGKILYVNVINGTASVNYTAKSKWLGNNTTISAGFGGNGYYMASQSTEDAKVTIDKQNVTIIMAPSTAKVGGKAQFTAYLFDSHGKGVNSGRVGFKVNGITLRNSDNTPVYATVSNGFAIASVDINPRWTAENVIMAVYGGTSYYNSIRSDNSTLSITE